MVSSNQVAVQVTLVPAGGDPITFSAAPGTTWLLAPAGDGPNPASLTFDGSTVASIDEAGPVCQPGILGPSSPPSSRDAVWVAVSRPDSPIRRSRRRRHARDPGWCRDRDSERGSVWYLAPGAVRLGSEVIASAEPADCPDPAAGPMSLESACATVDGATERWWPVTNDAAVGVSVQVSGAGTVEGIATPATRGGSLPQAPMGRCRWLCAPGPRR